MNTLDTAAREYAKRPPDERFETPAAMLEAAQYDRDHSREVTYNTRDLSVVSTSPDAAGGLSASGTLRLQSPKGSAGFTHWSFGQLARMVGAPASYLRQLPPAIAADALNFGLHDAAEHATDAKLLVKANGAAPIIRACTSETYGRVWDAELYGATLETLARDPQWKTPPTWTGESAGAYRGDRDSFLIMVNGGSIVTDPSILRGGTDSRGSGDMYRGIMIRNSEVGACSITIDLILFRYVCGNHMLWGAMYDQRFKRRHVGDHARRDAIRTIYGAARKWADTPAGADEAIIRGLIDREIAATRDAVIDELRGLGTTREQAGAAYDTAERTESASPRSFWGIANGITRISQTDGYQDGRLELDQLAAAVLARGRKLVAA